MKVDVTLSPGGDYFEAGVDGKHAGQLEFTRHDGVIVYTHTEVDDEFEGNGVGGALVRAALDAARAEGVKVVPRCPFVKGWIERHPDYADLVQSR
ncbi:N-acetyltransferase [Streptosporangium sp. NBC_01639]|uniref:GNAT family N-acetyltransferase n=1 Tax=unclassified Streptosporangium TaxID=2632669 RepID=UPI002DDAFFBB|nr:GNAT family N-acetyltransferase [Streptosporangium sp. NBC_01756]WSC90276.1 N-acetyltransferase [Streptosporangium sp. NBC_01756]WTD51113.1 N-acetyltransferase [Streptosporangium sp. NBC_01639]